MKKLSTFLLTVLMLIASTRTIQAAEIYATSANGQFTLYYDNKKATRSDVVTAWTETDGTGGVPKTIKDAITSIVLDQSMQNARPTSTMMWFENFKNATQITGLNYLNTSDVTDMTDMFRGCSSLTALDVSGFDTRNVTDMTNMFMGCYSLTALDLSGFDTQNVTNMQQMFFGCSSLTSLNLSRFDTHNVQMMIGMFRDCSYLTTLDLSKFDIQNVYTMKAMFFFCRSLTTIYCNDDWSKSTVLKNSDYMFTNCTSLVGGKGTVFDSYHSDASYARMDGGYTHPGYFSAKPTIYATSVGGTFTLYYDTEKDTRSGVVNDWTEADGAAHLSYSIRSAITSIVLSPSMQDARPTTTYRWFFNFMNATRISGLEYLNTSEVLNMDGMFFGCSSMTTLNLSDFDTRNVTDMGSMFAYCSSLATLDVSGFDTRNVITTAYMFQNCSALNTIYCSDDWSQNGSLLSSGNMFAGCEALVGGKGTTYDANYTNATYARPDKEGQPGYFTKNSSEAIDNVSTDKAQGSKWLRNGNIIIRVGDTEYNVQGARIQ